MLSIHAYFWYYNNGYYIFGYYNKRPLDIVILLKVKLLIPPGNQINMFNVNMRLPLSSCYMKMIGDVLHSVDFDLFCRMSLEEMITRSNAIFSSMSLNENFARR
jgi:hypothetical protein